MADAGDIYLDKYSGWYDVRDEVFYAEADTTVDDDGGDRVAADNGHKLDLDRGRNILLPAFCVSGPAARAVRGASRVHRAGCAA